MTAMAVIVPHPPLIIPAVGGKRIDAVKKTVEGMQELADEIKSFGPERLIVLTPHGPMLHNAVSAFDRQHLFGSFAAFGAPDARVYFVQDLTFLSKLEKEAAAGPLKLAIHAADYGEQLDHGAAVPLYYLQQAGIELVGLHLTVAAVSYREHYQFGRALRRAADACGLKTVVIASGDLSHRLIRGAPAGYNPRGREFDLTLVDLLQEGKYEQVVNMDPDLVAAAGECGLRSIAAALGFFAEDTIKTRIFSYEGPYGVGYLVASLQPVITNQACRNSGAEAVASTGAALEAIRLAREALRCHLEKKGKLRVPAELPAELQAPAGVFVSLKKNGHLRGCIGTVQPAKKSAAEEIIENAVSAGSRDPRFQPVTLDELEGLEISVDLLKPPERIESEDQLDPRLYGVLVRRGYRSGLLLPNLEGIDTVEEQVAIARQKAGIAPHEPVELYRFRVIRYTEKENDKR